MTVEHFSWLIMLIMITIVFLIAKHFESQKILIKASRCSLVVSALGSQPSGLG